MNNKPNDGGPAFPETRSVDDNENPSPVNRHHFEDSVYIKSTSGMTLRDWFAGQALSGLMALPDERWCPKEIVDKGQMAIEEWRESACLEDARRCYRMANSMLKARGAND